MEPLVNRLKRQVPGFQPAQPTGLRPGIKIPGKSFPMINANSVLRNIPGSAATKTVLNSPATKGLVRSAGKRIPVAGGLLNAGLATYDVSQGADPLRAYGKAATEMAGGALGAGAAGLLAIPSGPGAAVAAGAGYMGGSTAAGTAFDALFPQTVNPVVPEKKPSSSSSEKAKKVPAGAFGDIVNKFDRSMAPSNVPAGAFGDIVNKFDNAMNPSSETEIKFELPTFAATGTDTGSGDREVLREEPRVAQTDDMDANMRAWAAANPELAQKVINKKTKQSGRAAIEKEILGRAATETDMASYDKDETFLPSEIPMEDRNMTKGFGDRKGSTKARTGIAPDQESQNLLNQYMSDIKGQFAELSAPSAVQNPIPMGGDGTAIDSQLELSKKAGALIPGMTFNNTQSAVTSAPAESQLERENREYAALKFVRDPKTGGMVEAK